MLIRLSATMQPLPLPKEKNSIAASKNTLRHAQLSEQDTLGKFISSPTLDFLLNSVTALSRLFLLVMFSFLHRKSQRSKSKNLLKRNQFNLPQIREEGVVGEQQCWGWDTGTQRKNFIQTCLLLTNGCSYLLTGQHWVMRNLNIVKSLSLIKVMNNSSALPSTFFKNITTVKTMKTSVC